MLLQLAAHQHLAAALLDLARGRFPHHARALARILEALDQRLDDRPAGLRLARCGSSAFFSAFITATPRSSPLMRCAAQSAEISSHDMPHTFSV